MNFAQDLLFLHGHITDPRSLDAPASTRPAGRPAAPAARPPAVAKPGGDVVCAAPAPDRLAPALRRLHAPLRFFGGLLPLAPLAPRADDRSMRFGHSYGNALASRRLFGGPAGPACSACACG